MATRDARRSMQMTTKRPIRAWLKTAARLQNGSARKAQLGDALEDMIWNLWKAAGGTEAALDRVVTQLGNVNRIGEGDEFFLEDEVEVA